MYVIAAMIVVFGVIVVAFAMPNPMSKIHAAQPLACS